MRPRWILVYALEPVTVKYPVLAEDKMSKDLHRQRSGNTSIVLNGLKEIEGRIEGLIETYEISSDKRLLREIQASLKEAQRGKGRPISEIVSDLGKMTKRKDVKRKI